MRLPDLSTAFPLRFLDLSLPSTDLSLLAIALPDYPRRVLGKSTITILTQSGQTAFLTALGPER